MLDDLILLRLLAGSNASLAKVRTDILPLISTPSAESGRKQFAAAVDRLVQSGHMVIAGTRQGQLQLTNAGQSHARAFFRIPRDEAPPKRRGWATWRDRYAVPLALGVKSLDNADAVRGALLRRLYLPELSTGVPVKSLRAIVDLLLAKRLVTSGGRAGNFRIAALRSGMADATTPTAAPHGGAPSLPHPPAQLPADLERFAKMVNATAGRCTTGRFGDNKVFISHVWNALLAAGYAAPPEERAFKDRLVRANTAGLLRLSRSDLAGAHDAQDVRASETRYLGEVFHFLWLD